MRQVSRGFQTLVPDEKAYQTKRVFEPIRFSTWNGDAAAHTESSGTLQIDRNEICGPLDKGNAKTDSRSGTAIGPKALISARQAAAC
jgi:hypothetical protein